MEKKNKNRYDGRMDEECIPLCDALNSLPGVETTSSCCGHCKNDFIIFFNCNNSYSLSVIARAFSRRYSGTFLAWKIEVETHDNGGHDYFMHSVKPYPTEFEMKTDVGQLIENLEVWKAEEYKDYFNYKGEEEQPDFGIPQEVIEQTVQEYLSVEERPFCLESAKSGKPVCTRDGRKARVICFDSTLENYPLVVLVGDYPYSYTAEGKFNKDSESSSDLMMLPEKKEGLVH